MPKANAKGRDFCIHDGARRCDGVITWLWVARSIREKHAVRLMLHDGLERGLRGNDCDSAAALSQHTQDVVLRAEVECDHFELGLCQLTIASAKAPLGRCPRVGCLSRDLLRQI